MKNKRMCLIAGTFAFFQFIMPLIGWVLIKTLITFFSVLEKFIPYFALILLGFLGVKSIIAGIKNEEEKVAVGIGALIVQGIATSIDALSVGFTIAEYTFPFALVEALIIGIVVLVGGGLLFFVYDGTSFFTKGFSLEASAKIIWAEFQTVFQGLQGYAAQYLTDQFKEKMKDVPILGQ